MLYKILQYPICVYFYLFQLRFYVHLCTFDVASFIFLPSNLEIHETFYSLQIRWYHQSNSCQHAEGTGQRGKNQIGKRNSSSVTAVVAVLQSTLTRTHRCSRNIAFTGACTTASLKVVQNGCIPSMILFTTS